MHLIVAVGLAGFTLLNGASNYAVAPTEVTTQYSVIGENSFVGGAMPSNEQSWLSDEVYRATLASKMILLAKCESGNNPLAVNWHDNGSPSYGLFQWKEASWIYQIRKFGYLEEAENKELMNYIYDREWQERITLATLQETNGFRHWTNCWKIIN